METTFADWLKSNGHDSKSELFRDYLDPRSSRDLIYIAVTESIHPKFLGDVCDLWMQYKELSRWRPFSEIENAEGRYFITDNRLIIQRYSDGRLVFLNGAIDQHEVDVFLFNGLGRKFMLYPESSIEV